MASKELIDEYVLELGNYLNQDLKRFLNDFGGEGKFISSLIVPIHSLEFEPDTDNALIAVQSFNENFGYANKIELLDVQLNENLEPRYEGDYSGSKIFDNSDDCVTVLFGRSCQFELFTMEFLSKEVSDEALIDEIKELKMKTLKICLS